MTIVVGTDEAGYGPNLGPLVVAASVWHVAAAPEEVEGVLGTALEAAARVADPAAGRVTPPPLWADSKQVYRAGAERGAAALEAGVLTAVALATGTVPIGWQAFAAATGIDSDAGQDVVAPLEWSRLSSLTLPQWTAVGAVAERARTIAAALAGHGVHLVRVAGRVVHPREFNSLLAAGLNKSDILSQVTLTLAADVRRGAADGAPAVIWCDRHGGRKHYAAVVSRHFDSPLVRPVVETAGRSVYELPTARCRIEFCVGGERRGPVALASMAAKYVRELAMQAFNAHWATRCPGLAPTAGYPVDAARWRRDAAEAIRAHGIADDVLWRRV